MLLQVQEAGVFNSKPNKYGYFTHAGQHSGFNDGNPNSQALVIPYGFSEGYPGASYGVNVSHNNTRPLRNRKT
jgi:hypothetical protein